MFWTGHTKTALLRRVKRHKQDEAKANESLWRQESLSWFAWPELMFDLHSIVLVVVAAARSREQLHDGQLPMIQGRQSREKSKAIALISHASHCTTPVIVEKVW